ncbi:MAG: serine protease [Clostridia bacterium]|nr:serine protease [Clostridia bacterium]
MKTKAIKKIAAAFAVAGCVAISAFAGGCTTVKIERDNISGKDLNIYDVYAAAKQETNNPDLTFSEFLKEYLSYTSSELEEATSLQAAINRSLLSCVSLRVRFARKSGPGTFAMSGSGVIIDIDREKGEMTVATNCHVVYSAEAMGDGYSDEVDLWLYGSESAYEGTYESNKIPAKVIAASKTYDVALLKVNNSEIVKGSKAVKAEWSLREENYIGERVYAVGNANGETISASDGIISKDIESIRANLGTESNQEIYEYSVLRTSAAISSGNSGGGLYNASGELIGLVNAKHKDDALSAGYALCAASARRVINRMLSDYNGKETHGVRIAEHGIEAEVLDSYSTGLNKDGFAEIVELVTVDENLEWPAQSKFQKNDVINHVKIIRPLDGGTQTVEDADITREHIFHNVLLSAEAGDTAEFTVLRPGEKEPRTITITFTEDDMKVKD